MRNFERRIEYSDQEAEYRECVERLYSFLKETAQDFKKEGVPVDDSCNIDMDAFRDVYKDVENDKKLVERLQQKWLRQKRPEQRKSSEEERRKEKLEHIGEQLEMLVTAIFIKFLGKDYIVVHTASYDDINNGVDNLILDKKTGKIICAFDEVGNTNGPKFEEKKEKILEKDREQGGYLKYGLGIKDGKLTRGEQNNIPIFYLALPERFIRKGVREFISSREDKGDFEGRLFEVFKNSILSQISALELELKLNQEIENNISHFKEILENDF